MSQVTRLFRAPSSPHCCSETHRVDRAPDWAQPALTPTCTRVRAWQARPWALSLPEEGKDPRYGASEGRGRPQWARRPSLASSSVDQRALERVAGTGGSR